MLICTHPEHRFPHELPCPCCGLCGQEHEVKFDVLPVGAVIEARPFPIARASFPYLTRAA